MNNKTINVYAVNLPERTDRRASIIEQFADKPEFRLTIVDGIEHRNGPYGLWQTFYGIVEREAAGQSEFFIFCEDDHVFTENYSVDLLRQRIAEADSLEADLLSGGMSVVRTPVEIMPGLFWVSWFNGMQFTVIFRRCYEKILQAGTSEGYAVDIQLSYLAKRKYVMAPYISLQREFGYSDATSMNEEDGRVTMFFNKMQSLLGKLHQVREHYGAISRQTVEAIMQADVSRAFIPTYVINLPERTDRLAHIQQQFADKPEFQVNVIEASRHDVGAIGLWESICRIVRLAKEKDEDFVLICEDDHVFTGHYDRDRLLRQIMLAGAMGAELLSGGIGDFSNLVALPGGLCWVDRFWCTQFIVLYSRAYDTILNARFGVRNVADDHLSDLLTAKMVTIPFISEQTDFGYSDITESNNRDSMIIRHFDNARRQLRHYAAAYAPAAHMPVPVPISGFLASPDRKRLHLGCGLNLINGWLNTDVNPDYGVTFLDVSQPFPLPDCSVDLIFAEHLLETFAPKWVDKIFRECYRTMTPGGTLRLTFYTADALSRITDSNELNSHIRQFSKSYLHLVDEIYSLLCSAGFADLRQCRPDESQLPELRNINRHKIYGPIEKYLDRTITIEATKPHN